MDSLLSENVELGTLYPVDNDVSSENTSVSDKSSKKKRGRRWRKSSSDSETSPSDFGQKREELKEVIRDLLKKRFSPEFLNRFNEKPVFNPIFQETFKQIFEMKLNQQIKQVAENTGIVLSFSNAAKNFLAQK